MNREILFRGKRTDNGEWTHGYLFRIWEKAYICWGTVNDIPDMKEVDPETVCQYTGLTDKNGRKIFEGDIINDIDYGIMKCIYLHGSSVTNLRRQSTALIMKCIYLHGSFVWYKEDGSKIERMRDIPVIEVIGNIFDNPELLEGE